MIELMTMAIALFILCAVISLFSALGLIIVFSFVISLIYLMPAVVLCHKRDSTCYQFAWLNALIGWTIIGWLVLLIYALNQPSIKVRYPQTVEL